MEDSRHKDADGPNNPPSEAAGNLTSDTNQSLAEDGASSTLQGSRTDDDPTLHDGASQFPTAELNVMPRTLGGQLTAVLKRINLLPDTPGLVSQDVAHAIEAFWASEIDHTRELGEEIFGVSEYAALQRNYLAESAINTQKLESRNAKLTQIRISYVAQRLMDRGQVTDDAKQNAEKIQNILRDDANTEFEEAAALSITCSLTFTELIITGGGLSRAKIERLASHHRELEAKYGLSPLLSAMPPC